MSQTDTSTGETKVPMEKVALGQPGDPTDPPPPPYPVQYGYQPQPLYPPQTGYPTQQAIAPYPTGFTQPQAIKVVPGPSPVAMFRNPVCGPKPHDYLILNILVTVFCCWPIGVVGLVKSRQVKTSWAAGDSAGAEAASVQAKNSAILGIVAGVIGIAVFVVYIFVIY